ncbi:hypothetical protein ACQEWB_00655 [Streptomyces sp. CA-249302]|uniref:hypothetical protein n=1 Tax=Streptomyces sp. CA-249302 TaxID=3240058 RepID=UPI003D9456DC
MGEDAQRSGQGSSGNGAGGGRGGWRASLTAAGTAVALAFVTVFFGWLPNPFAGEGRAETSTPTPSKQAGLEVVARDFPEPSRIPAAFRDGTVSRDGSLLAARLALTLRNRGDLKAAVTEFRFTVREEKNLYSSTGASPCLPNTGGITKITADYGVDLSKLEDQDLPATLTVKGDYDLAAGEVERVLFTMGDTARFSPTLYLMDVELREGTGQKPIKAGTVAFLGPIGYQGPPGITAPYETANAYLKWLHAVARSDLVPCDRDLVRDVDRILAEADDRSAEADRLKAEVDVLERRLREQS